MEKHWYSYPWQLTAIEYEYLSDKEKKIYNKGDTYIRCNWEFFPYDMSNEGYELLSKIGYTIVIINSMGEKTVTFHKPIRKNKNGYERKKQIISKNKKISQKNFKKSL